MATTTSIAWQEGLERTLERIAGQDDRHVLLDFSAAPT
jgi:hypothetical protein